MDPNDSGGARLSPEAIYAPMTPGTAPTKGWPSELQGRKQACFASIGAAARQLLTLAATAWGGQGSSQPSDAVI